MNREDIQRFATQARLPQNYMTGEAMWLDRLKDLAELAYEMGYSDGAHAERDKWQSKAIFESFKK